MAQTNLIDESRVSAAFFLSGFSALVYQVAWQRLLFGIVGVDIESVTIVVSTFMLGLGIGAPLGGALADIFHRRILIIFCIFEAVIAMFGLFSVDLINSTSTTFSSLARPAAALLSFTLLLLPTVCMGATLPMLVANRFKTLGNVGISTGQLYFINTMGAAFGTVAVGFLLFYWLDVRETVTLAACINLLASVIIATGLLKR